MKITVTTLTDYIFELDVSEELELENFKAFCEVESGFPSAEIVISFRGQALIDDKKSLKDHGLGEGDVVLLQHALQSGLSGLAGAGTTAAAPQHPSTSNGTLNQLCLLVLFCNHILYVFCSPVWP